PVSGSHVVHDHGTSWNGSSLRQRTSPVRASSTVTTTSRPATPSTDSPAPGSTATGGPLGSPGSPTRSARTRPPSGPGTSTAPPTVECAGGTSAPGSGCDRAPGSYQNGPTPDPATHTTSREVAPDGSHGLHDDPHTASSPPSGARQASAPVSRSSATASSPST